MRAIVCQKFAPPESLEVIEVDDPVPQDGEVLINIKATGLGFVDALTVAGEYQIKPPLPFIPGNEISGVVEETGPKAKHLRVGQRILAMPSRGGLAEKVCIPESACFTIPEVLSHEAAASFLVNYCTASHGLDYCGNLKPGETVLILGAAGGVGAAAIDVAKSLKAEVIAAASTQKKRDACIELGADHVIDYSKKNWRNDVESMLDGKPLNIVYDPVGGNYSEPALRSLGAGGRFLVVGFASGKIASVPLNLPLLKRCNILGINWGAFVAANEKVSRPVVTKLIQKIAGRTLKPHPGETFPLEDAGVAMTKMLNRETIGKIVITM